MKYAKSKVVKGVRWARPCGLTIHSKGCFLVEAPATFSLASKMFSIHNITTIRYQAIFLSLRCYRHLLKICIKILIQ
jgi:hypothetical protein